MRLIVIAGHFIARLSLAMRFYLALGYSWRLAWAKAGRG